MFISLLLSVPTTRAQEADFGDIELRRAPLVGEARLSLQRTVEIALESNPDLVVERLRIEQSRAGVEEEKGVYDPVFSMSGLAGRRDNVIASRFFPTGEFTEENFVYGAGLNGVTHLGSRYSLDLNYQRQISTSNTQSLSPQYSATLDLTYSQPLFRDFGTDVTLTQLRIAQREQDISEENLAIGLTSLIFEVVESYWNLVFATEDLAVRRASFELAEALLEQTETLFESGQLSELDVLEARAGVFERREDVIRFENQVAGVEDLLKILMYADMAVVSVTPTEPLIVVPADPNPQESNDRALGRRPEILRLQTVLEQRQNETIFASNQVRPRIDLNLTYGMSGLSGRPNLTLVNPGNPLQGFAGSTVAGSVFAGLTRPLGAFNRFFSGDSFDNWSVELRVELPLRNRTAEARLANAGLREKESQVTLATVEEQVVFEIRQALRDLSTATESIDASREAVRYVEDQLVATRTRFEAGLSTSYDVLRVLETLALSRRRELQALTDHNIARAALSLAEGRILEDFNVEVGGASRSNSGTSF